MMADEEKPETPEQPAETSEGAETSEQAEGGRVAPKAEQPGAGEEAGVAATDAQLEAGQEAVSQQQGGEAASQRDAGEVTSTASGGGAGESAHGKPSVPGAHLEVDIVPEGVDPLGSSEGYEDPYAIEDEDALADEPTEEGEEDELAAPIATAAIDLASGARYRATGKRKTATARVTLRPGSGAYLVNGRSLEEHFPRTTLQRNIRQPLEAVGYEERMDVVARLHGGGISAQAGALRHGVSRALLEADPNLRGELKRRGFLTRDSRAKERKKAGLKKARKRPQFSKR
jgi:small subunit ribosomal protein S9